MLTEQQLLRPWNSSLEVLQNLSNIIFQSEKCACTHGKLGVYSRQILPSMDVVVFLVHHWYMVPTEEELV